MPITMCRSVATPIACASVVSGLQRKPSMLPYRGNARDPPITPLAGREIRRGVRLQCRLPVDQLSQGIRNRPHGMQVLRLPAASCRHCDSSCKYRSRVESDRGRVAQDLQVERHHALDDLPDQLGRQVRVRALRVDCGPVGKAGREPNKPRSDVPGPPSSRAGSVTRSLPSQAATTNKKGAVR